MPAAIEPQQHTIRSTSVTSDFSARTYRILLAGLIVLAAFLRFWHLGSRGLFIDEGYSWAIAKLPWGEFLRTLTTRTGEMPLHYVVTKLWNYVGDSETALRIPSAIFGLGAVLLIAEAGRVLYSRHAGIFAASFLTVHVFAIKFSQEARTYPLVVMLVSAGWLLLARAVRAPSRRNWTWFNIVAIATVYAHLLAGFSVAAQFLTLIFLTKEVGWRRIGESVVFVAVGVAPAALYALAHKPDLEWIKSIRLPIFLEFLDDVSGMGENWIQTALVVLLFAVIVVAFVAAIARERSGWNVWALSVPVIGFVAPVLAIIAFSENQPVFVPRYLGYVVVPLLLGLGWLCTKATPRLAVAAASILIVLFAWPLSSYYRESSRYKDPAWQDFRGAAQYIIQREKPGDSIVIFEPMSRPAVEYYGSRSSGFPKIIFPRSADHFQADDMLMRPDPYRLPALFASSGRIWVLYNFEKSPEEYKVIPALYIRRTLAKTHHLVSAQQFKSARVEEFVP
jgi:mannosyltransferase